jgi:cell division septum initiation protein DivIVA
MKRGLFGYRKQPVDRLLEEIADSFEVVWRERADLADKVEHLEAELSRHRDLETLLRTTLTSAESAAHDLKDKARRESELILGEAHSEARSIVREATAEHERLQAEIRRVKALLSAALDAVEDADRGDGRRAPKAEAA